MSPRSRVVIFVGPTISGHELDALVSNIDADVSVLPPVVQGDIVKLYTRLPDVIAIIDGYFHQQPAVYHKEILGAIERGAYVIGAASMGALRAAELSRFGMEGVGEIYAMYRDGEIDGDDMVALVHGDASSGYLACSIPLVNVRYAVHRAVTGGVLTAHDASLVLASAARLYYGDRTLADILSAARDCGLPAPACNELENYLQGSDSDLKKNDARQLLMLIAERCCTASWPLHDPIRVHATTYFMRIQQDYLGHVLDGCHLTNRFVINVQRLFSSDAQALARRVQRQCWAVDEARERGLRPASSEHLLEHFSARRNLAGHADTERWLERHYLTREELGQALADRDLAEQLTRDVRCVLQSRRSPGQVVSKAEVWDAIFERVSTRIGLDPNELHRRDLQHPGVAWDEPLTRELKLLGKFGRALRLARRVREVYDALERRSPGTAKRVTSDSVIAWFAARWGVAVKDVGSAIAARGFLNHPEFLETAKVAYFFDHVRASQQKKQAT